MNQKLRGPIPNFNLPELELMYLFGNQLEGPLPNFNLTKLASLHVASNRLSDNIPPLSLPNLVNLQLWGNQFTGTIPNFSLPKLLWCYLNNNRLSGTIPNFDFPLLTILHLNNNNLSGSIPNFNLPQLIDLRLRNNKLMQAPKFSQMPRLGAPTTINDSLTLQYNALTFDDILPNMPLINGFNNGRAKYAPQDSIFRDTTIVRTAGQALTIDLGIDADLANNIYQWYKNGSPWAPPAGNSNNSNKLIFNTLQASDAGTYYVKVTNPDAPALTLYGRSIKIQVNACVSSNTLQITGSTTFCSGSNTKLRATAGFAQYLWSSGQTTASISVNVAQTYTVTITDKAGCTQIAKTTINNAGTPVMTRIDTSICEGNFIQIGNNFYEEATEKYDTLKRFNGCDSIIYLNLRLKEEAEIVAVDDVFSFDTTLTVVEIDITNNDMLADSVVLTGLKLPKHGTLKLLHGNILQYTIKKPNFIGRDTFEYSLCIDACRFVCDTAKCIIIRTNEIAKSKNPHNAFSPNGDGKNDLFDPLAWHLQHNSNIDRDNVELIIRNEWGELIYRSSYEPWDGTNNGKQLPIGAYLYTLKGEKIKEQGIINLLR
jgi:gliding motility-associated-like protein